MYELAQSVLTPLMMRLMSMSRLPPEVGITTGSDVDPELGPLHTRAMSPDHEFVRSQKKVSQRPSQHTSKIM
jgi:hypothetical protein